MTRLIDADALAKFIDYGHLNNPNEKLYSENDIREMIDMMPTVDAEPVRHGKWIKHEYAEETEGMLIPNYECSECHAWERKESDYCPNCGAKMSERMIDIKKITNAEEASEYEIRDYKEIPEFEFVEVKNDKVD